MSLVAGTRLGPYEIQSAIGAGGMGEVYKARDTRLDRTVAIKVLPAELNADPDRRTRFEREARAVAALSHPHICTLYDIGTAPSTGSGQATLYLVMEHLAGESLAERLHRGPLPLTQALGIGAQIAEALDSAHKHGIIHRDLKPGNVMLTTGGAGRSGVMVTKLLDFGLAKLAAHGERPAVAGGASVPTQAAPVTAEGTILGTLQYMAPEQLEGKEADARTDIWALGAILFEMLTGRRAFEGESQVSLIGNIMNAEPVALSTLQPLTPPSLDRLVKKCLAKPPDDRWDTAHDVADELRWIAQTAGAVAVTAVQPPRRRGLLTALMMVVALVAAMLGGGVVWLLRPAPPAVSPARLSLDVRPADELNAGGVGSSYLPTPGGSRTAFVWTPDGQALVFVGRRGGVQQLHVRRLDAATARPLAGTEGAQVPAVSADGRWVAFWADGAIKKVPLGGGPVATVATGIAGPPRGLVWDGRGGLYFGKQDNRIWTVPPDGTPAAVTTLDDGELAHTLPWLLPDGRSLLYTVRKRFWSWGDEEIIAQAVATGVRKRLLNDAADARYVPTGHLVFLRRSQLYAVPFDVERLEFRGKAEAVLDEVAQALTGWHAGNLTGAGQFAVAATGTLAWVPGPVAPYPDTTLVTVDRRGQVTPLPAPAKSYAGALRRSPDGRHLAVIIETLGGCGLWIYDLGRGTLTPRTVEGEVSWTAGWSPDGQRVLFLWLRDGRWLFAAQPADGSASPQVLVPGEFNPSSVTPDGRQVIGVSGGDLVSASIERGTGNLQPVMQTPHAEGWPALSPDGRWLAYGSNVSGRPEVYVQPYSAQGFAEVVSLDGGDSPAWHPNGRELFFLSLQDQAGKRRMMAVDFAAGPPPRLGRPRVLFQFDNRDLRLACAPLRCYDVAPDGQRFYGVQSHTPPPTPVVTHINLILNWFEELKAKVPAGGVK